MALDAETYEYQHQLAVISRTGKSLKLPGADEKRSQVYRRLVFNGIEDTLKKAYPISYKILCERENSEKNWNDLVTKFIAEYPSTSPQLWQMPMGLIDFVLNNDLGHHYQLPYLADLMRFEWLEIEIFMMEDLVVGNLTSFDVSRSYSTNPESKIIDLNYPVYRKPVTESSNHPGNYFICCFREPLNKQVKFLELSALQVLILDKADHIYSINDLNIILEQICKESGLNFQEAKQSLGNFIEAGCRQGLFTTPIEKENYGFNC